MNLRDLWDNVVLRDILGYIVPGLVTLFAIALLVGHIAGTSLLEMVLRLADSAGLGFLEGEHWMPWRPWLLWGFLVPLGYVLGHLQMWVADPFEAGNRLCNNGKLSLRFLQESGTMGAEYCRLASQTMKVDHFKTLCNTLGRTDRNSSQSDEGAVGSQKCESTAGDLWRLCDRFVLVKNRNLHGMFMGRYYVLAVLFSNLGISGILLGVCLLLSQWCLHPMPAAIGGLACAVLGGLMLARSMHFRKRFIECTFPIFYAIVQAEDSPKPAKA